MEGGGVVQVGGLGRLRCTTRARSGKDKKYKWYIAKMTCCEDGKSGSCRVFYGVIFPILRTNPVDPSSPPQKLTHTINSYFTHTEFSQLLSGFVSLNAGYTVSVRRTRLNVLVLLTLALAGESPTCVLHEGMHTP